MYISVPSSERFNLSVTNQKNQNEGTNGSCSIRADLGRHALAMVSILHTASLAATSWYKC